MNVDRNHTALPYMVCWITPSVIVHMLLVPCIIDPRLNGTIGSIYHGGGGGGGGLWIQTFLSFGNLNFLPSF